MPEKKDTKTKPAGLVLKTQTDAQLAEGERRVLDCGLGVVLAPANTQAFARTTAAAVRKFGNRNTEDLGDLKPQKRIDALIWVAANATFLGFYDPASDKPEFSVDVSENGVPDYLSFEGNTVENRIRILSELPMIRGQINDEVSALTDEVSDSTEAASGN